MRVAFLGFGLIAGSIARALREAPGPWHLSAWTPSGAGPRRALTDGIVDRAAELPADAIGDAEIVVLAAPPLASLDLLTALGGSLGSRLGAEAVVTDVTSTKGLICERARQLGIRFVGGHPMAGRETTGYGSADAALFRDRPWIVVPDDARPDDVARIEALAIACGARPLQMDAATHDDATAAISHLPLVAAAAIVEAVTGAPDWAIATGLAASGWRDTTRLARGDPAMGAGIVATNAPALAARVRSLRDTLDEWLLELERAEGADPARIEARFSAARRRLSSVTR